MGDEYDGSPLFLFIARHWYSLGCAAHVTYMSILSFVDQAVIKNTCRRIPESDIGIITEAEDPGTNDILRKEVFKPKCFSLRVHPGSHRLSVQSMDGNDT